jgi:hypothetical protein
VIYAYITDDGDRDDRVFPIGQAPATVQINGKVAHRDYAAELPTQTVAVRENVKKGHKQKIAKWPMRSDQLGVHPSEIPAEKAMLKERGITGVDFDQKTGEAIVTKKGRKDYARLYKLNDKKGGYGDP